METQRWPARWKTKRWFWDSTLTAVLTLALLLQAATVRAGKKKKNVEFVTYTVTSNWTDRGCVLSGTMPIYDQYLAEKWNKPTASFLRLCMGSIWNFLCAILLAYLCVMINGSCFAVSPPSDYVHQFVYYALFGWISLSVFIFKREVGRFLIAFLHMWYK